MIELRFEVESSFTGQFGFTGPPLRAAFLSLLRECDEQLSGRVHDERGIRTYALQPFPCGRDFTTTFLQGQIYYFRVNLLDSDRYRDAIRQFALRAGRSLRVHHEVFHLRRIDFSSYETAMMMDSWIEEFRNTFDDTVRIVMSFITPTQLSAYGSDYACLLPSPERVFTSLLRVWNQIEGKTAIEHVSDYRDWVEKNVHVSAYNLRTAEVDLGRERSIVGFLGRVVYTLRNATSPLGMMTAGLAKFAELSNVGKNRTAGFGQVEVRLETGFTRGERETVHPTG
ncbi:MAG: CRISPR system precrRNA processing endoribonuclease RAMP protein Cas6 [Candidatus Thorarchaeota archaeon]